MAADIKVQRGTSTTLTANTTVTITAGVDYVAPSAASKAFCRVVSSQNISAQSTTDTIGSAAINAVATDDSAILTQVVFTRAGANSNNARIDWEIVEYIGSASGPHEFVVRGRGLATMADFATTATTAAISGIVTDADVVPWVTSVKGGGSADIKECTVTAVWNSAGDTATFTRANLTDQNAMAVSWAIVEFTGVAWSVQSVEMGITAAGTETSTISTVGDVSRAFMHIQARGGGGLAADDTTFLCWLSDATTVSFTAPTGYTATRTVKAWVISNSQTGAGAMNVARYSGTNAGGGTATKSITAVTMADSSVMEPSMALASTNTGLIRMNMTMRLTATDTVTLYRSIADGTADYRFAVVTWPQAPSTRNTANSRIPTSRMTIGTVGSRIIVTR